MEDVCAFVRGDKICKKPPRTWKKQYEKLLKANQVSPQVFREIKPKNHKGPGEIRRCRQLRQTDGNCRNRKFVVMNLKAATRQWNPAHDEI